MVFAAVFPAVFAFCLGEGFLDRATKPFNCPPRVSDLAGGAGAADGTGFLVSAVGCTGAGGFNSGGEMFERGGCGEGEGGTEAGSVGARSGGAAVGWYCCEDWRDT